MKRVAFLLLLAGWLAPLAKAQDHIQVGGYGDYFRISQTKTNMAGLGVRAGYKAFPHVMLVPSNIKVLHWLFGPKIVGGHGAIHPFLTLKGGFVNFRLDSRPVSVGTAISSIENLRANNVSGALYPSAGLEGHIGPLGLRLEAGDEIYFAGSTHHNPRVAFGPFIRF